IGRLVARTGARSIAERYLDQALGVFTQLGAARDLAETVEARQLLGGVGTGEYVISSADADDAIVRRIVDAAALPDLLGRETAAALLEASSCDAAVVFVTLGSGDFHIVAAAGCDDEAAQALARSSSHRGAYGRGA